MENIYTFSGAVIVTGLVVVFLALVGLSLIVWLLGKVFIAMSNKPQKPTQITEVKTPPAAPKAPPAAPVVKAAMQTEDGISDEVIAVISAAVAAMSGDAGGFVLRSVRRAKEARPAWAQAGLQQNTQAF